MRSDIEILIKGSLVGLRHSTSLVDQVNCDLVECGNCPLRLDTKSDRCSLNHVSKYYYRDLVDRTGLTFTDFENIPIDTLKQTYPEVFL